jgi:hypothetical protein
MRPSSPTSSQWSGRQRTVDASVSPQRGAAVKSSGSAQIAFTVRTVRSTGVAGDGRFSTHRIHPASAGAGSRVSPRADASDDGCPPATAPTDPLLPPRRWRLDGKALFTVEDLAGPGGTLRIGAAAPLEQARKALAERWPALRGILHQGAARHRPSRWDHGSESGQRSTTWAAPAREASSPRGSAGVTP